MANLIPESMDRYERLVENIARLGTSMFAIKRPGTRPVTRDPEFVVLTLIVEEKLPMSEIGRRLHRSKPCITALVGRLIREGKVRKVPLAEDRRVMQIAITAKGRRVLRAKQQELRDRVRLFFSSLSDDEIGRVDTCLRDLTRIMARIGGA